ncbi:helix-turn-helix transcriptional regulator [Sphingomonas sp. CGMCC 1.13654]|uniref:Helix-turn-helix transcriptional regulator n=2 Tax=Sphingomonas chungangi TaxID=2683589 RepID=A0A838L2M9_9SPHN|nr:helix-turn-helix transcriptional regulator [Sphingomonas chungangi]MVW54973.1 helix-turn-helix domain-containing protein [Sphingomonas chungangi]
MTSGFTAKPTLGHAAADSELTMCRPRTVSHFEIEHALLANGIHADIRRFGWDRSCKGRFNAESYYIDYSLTPRAQGSRLLHDGHRAMPPPGEIVFLPRGSAFEAECNPCEQHLLCLTFDNDRANDLFESDAAVSDLAPCFDVRAPRVRQILARLVEEVRAPGFGADVLIESASLMLVVELCRHLQERQSADHAWRGRIADWRLHRLKDRIEAGLGEPMSVADLAAECGMSARHLIRTFKNTVGMTLTEYIAAARIRRAQEELAKEDALIKIVAFNCGYQSAAAFSASFRKATGLSPKQYRQERFRYAT